MDAGRDPDATLHNGSSTAQPSRIVGSGEMADLVRAYDWSSTPLGPIESWSKELLTIVNLTLCSPSPARAMWGPEFTLIYNDAYRPIPGPRHPGALGKPAREVYGESWHVVGPLLENAFATGETLFYEKLAVPLPTNDGIRDFYLNYSFNPIFEDGKIVGLFGSLQDVTGEVVAVRSLRESEARAMRILQSIGDAVIVTDPEARITRMNPVAARLTGWTAEEATGRPLPDVFRIFDEDTRQPVESPAEKVKRLGSVVGLANHTVLRAKDGSETYIDDSGAPIRGDAGELTGIVLIFRDIGEKRRLEQQRETLLSELSARYAELEATYNNAAVAMALIDASDFRYLRVNRTLCEMLGLPEEQIVGSSVNEVAAGVHGLQEALRTVASGKPVIGGTLEGELTTSQGVRRFWTMDYTPVYGPDGSVVAIAAASAEITRQKHAEAILIQNEKLAAVGRLASSIAHEINNPLESVTNLLYLIRTHDLPAEVQEYVDTAERELRRVSAITNQTLRFHKQSTSPTDVSFEEMIEGVLTVHQGRLVNSHVSVEKRLRALRRVRCFEGEIRQIIINLVGNAIDAMHPAGGKLFIRTRHARDLRNGAEGLMLTIADSGSGMPPQVARKVFEPFFTTKGLSGTGLGLWICKDIASRHNGRLRLRSSQRKGSRGTVFTLYLPCEAAARPPDPQPSR